MTSNEWNDNHSKIMSPPTNYNFSLRPRIITDRNNENPILCYNTNNTNYYDCILKNELNTISIKLPWLLCSRCHKCSALTSMLWRNVTVGCMIALMDELVVYRNKLKDSYSNNRAKNTTLAISILNDKDVDCTDAD